MCDYRTMSDGVEWADVGERLRAARLAAGLTQEELGTKAGLDRTMIVKIESGNRRIDAIELIRLSSALDVPVDFLLRPTPVVLSRRTSIMAEDAGTEVEKESGRLDLALVAWLHDVQQMVELGVLQPESPLKAETVVDGDVAVAVVSLRGDPGRRRATAAHELGHLVIGDEYSSDLGVHASRGAREALLDAFAAELLLPSRVLTEERGSIEAISRDQLISLAARYRTSWSLAIRQATQAGVLSGQARRDWARCSPTRSEFMEAVGWAPQPDLEAVRVPPHYAHAVIAAWRKGAITATRAVELMHGQITAADLPADIEADVEP